MALTATFEADFSQFVDAVKDAQLSLTDLTASYVSAEAIIRLADAAWQAFTDTLADSVTAAIEAEEADAQLAAALQAQGTAMPSVIAAYDAYAQALSQMIGVSDDVVKAAQGILVQIGDVMPRDMEKALLATANLAAGLRIDLTSAANLVAKAAQGQTGALERQAPRIGELIDKNTEFGTILDIINSKYKDNAQTMGETFGAALQKQKNAWDEVKESIGKVITNNETVRTLLGGLNELITSNTKELKANANANTFVSDAVILVTKGMIAAVDVLDVFQRGFHGLSIMVKNTEKSFYEFGIVMQQIEAETQSWVPGEAAAKAVAEAEDKIKRWSAAVKQLETDQANAKTSSDAWSQSLAAFKVELIGIEAKLESTRGQVHETTAAQTENAAVWDRQTKAVAATTTGLQEQPAAIETLGQSYANFGTDVTASALAHEEAAMASVSAIETTATTAITSTVEVAAEASEAVAHFKDEIIEDAKEAQNVWGGAMAGWTAGQGFSGGVGQLWTPTAGYNPATMPYAPGTTPSPAYLSGIAPPGSSLATPLHGQSWGTTPTVTFGPGSIVMNYPIVNDPQAMTQLGRHVGDAILSNMTRTGARV
jgi:hypothetical protein